MSEERNQEHHVEQGLKKLFKSGLFLWVQLAKTHPVAILVFSVVITVFSVCAAILYLGVDTNTAGMLSEELTFRKDLQEFRESFPKLENSLIVALKGTDKKQTRRAAVRLADALKKRSGVLDDVSYPEGNRFFQEHAALYRDLRELRTIRDNIKYTSSAMFPILQERNLIGVFDGLGRMLQEVPRSSEDHVEERSPDLQIKRRFFREFRRTLEAHLNDRDRIFRWNDVLTASEPETISETESPGFTYEQILVRPDPSFQTLYPGERALNVIRSTANHLDLEGKYGVQTRITGKIALQNEEMKQAVKGTIIASLLSIVFVLSILYVAFRSVKLVGYSLITLFVGLCWTAGITALTVGHLNLISLAFVVLYIGLGIDYAIHFLMGYRENRQEGETPADALELSSRRVGEALILCTLTTAIGFLSFVPTSFVGIAELGFIGGIGMVINFLVTLTLLPALLTISVPEENAGNFLLSAETGFSSFSRIPVRFRGPIILAAFAFAILTGWFATGIRFDYNPMHLRNPTSESVATFRELQATKTPPSSISVLAASRQEAKTFRERLEKRPAVKKVMGLQDFIPSDQEKKQAVFEEILKLNPYGEMAKLSEAFKWGTRSRAAADVLEFSPKRPPVDDVLASMHEFLAQLNTVLHQNQPGQVRDTLQKLKQSLERYVEKLDRRSDDRKGSLLSKLQKQTFSSFIPILQIFNTARDVPEITEEDLPEEIVSRWIDRQRRYRLQVFPARGMDDNESIRSFVSSVKEVAPSATGSPVVYLRAGQAIVESLGIALLIALVSMFLLLIVLLDRKRDVAYVLGPLLLVGVYTCGTMVMMGIPFNYANVIVLPLVLGIGADNGIHMLNRVRRQPAGSENVLSTGTARAVLFSALTTTGSFGNLILSSHRGMSSMGLVLTIGILFILLVTLVLLPALVSGS